MLWHEDIPINKTEGATIKIIAGVFDNTQAPEPAPNSWASDLDNEVAIWTLQIEANKSVTFPKESKGINSTLYFYQGDQITILGKEILPNHGVELDTSNEITVKAGKKAAHLLVLKGKPINEPIAKYGPFVMNTNEELNTAMEEFRLTQFGGWPWRYPDNVHDAELGRFAKYPDGTIVKK